MNPTTTGSVLHAHGNGAAASILTPQADREYDPTVIMIYGWLGAQPPTLRKYAEGYRNLYPSSTQVIVSSADPWGYWKFESARERAVLPALHKLQESGVLTYPESEMPPRILLHVMSNGGVMSLADVASALRKHNVHPVPGTKCAIILDSAPAPASFVLTLRAFTAGTRSKFKKLLVAVPLSVVLVLSTILRTLTRTPEPISNAMRKLNEPQLLPWTSNATPRLYMYSDADRIVPAKGVEEHAARAKMAGFPVQMMRFDGSAHVSHARVHPDKYWSTIRAFWSEAVVG